MADKIKQKKMTVLFSGSFLLGNILHGNGKTQNKDGLSLAREG